MRLIPDIIYLETPELESDFTPAQVVVMHAFRIRHTDGTELLMLSFNQKLHADYSLISEESISVIVPAGEK